MRALLIAVLMCGCGVDTGRLEQAQLPSCAALGCAATLCTSAGVCNCSGQSCQQLAVETWSCRTTDKCSTSTSIVTLDAVDAESAARAACEPSRCTCDAMCAIAKRFKCDRMFDVSKGDVVEILAGDARDAVELVVRACEAAGHRDCAAYCSAD